MRAVYFLFIYAYYLGVRLASLQNRKARAWIQGRKQLFEQLTNQISPSDQVIWVHCSSAGEFEQGKPLIEQMKAHYPGYKILVSFFSPSGYQVAGNYAFADLICYLPLDTPAGARQFLDLVHPTLVIFVKYDYWYYLLKETQKRGIPLLLVSAVFRNDQLFFKWYGSFYRNMLRFFNWIFVQDENSFHLLRSLHNTSCSIAGDTRFDRVSKITETFTAIPQIERFINGRPCLIAGSTWETDELLLSKLHIDGLTLIIAPHIIDLEHIDSIKKLFPGSVNYSAITGSEHSDCLIIDNVGMLARLYHYATITYVGGGFTKDGVHNVLEPAVYGKPVLYGSNYKKYQEATALIQSGGGFTFSNEAELRILVQNLLDDQQKLQKAGLASRNFIAKNTGATQKIINYIQENRLLTS